MHDEEKPDRDRRRVPLKAWWTHAASRVDPAFLLLFALPFLLLLLDPNWIFSDIYNDPWIYFGFFLNLPNHLQAFGDLYYSDRMTVLIPGYLCHLMLPDRAAHYVLHLGLYYVAVWSTYCTLRGTVGSRAAFLSALAMGSHYFFLKAIGWDYFDGFAITYLSASFFFLVVGGNSGAWRSALVLAGATATAAIVANPAVFFFTLPLAPLVLSVRGGFDWRDFSSRAGLFAMGGFLVLLALQGVYASVTGRPWTFDGSRYFIAANVSQANRAMYPISKWLWQASWLVFPCLSTLWAVLILASWRRRVTRPRKTLALIYSVMMLASVALVAGCAYKTGSNLFQMFPYANVILPVAFLVFGAALQRSLSSLSSREYQIVAAFAAVVLVCANALPPLAGSPNLNLSPLLLGLMPGFLATPLLFARSTASRCCLFFFLISLSQAIASYGFKVDYCLPPTMAFQFRGNRFDDRRIDLFRAVSQATRAAIELSPAADCRFWYNLGEPLGLVFKCIVDTHCDAPRVMSTSFPLTSDKMMVTGEPLRAGMIVVILTSSSDLPPVLWKAAAALAKYKLSCQVIRVLKIENASMRFFMVAVKFTDL